jgi:hypothetical protein
MNVVLEIMNIYFLRHVKKNLQDKSDNGVLI